MSSDLPSMTPPMPIASIPALRTTGGWSPGGQFPGRVVPHGSYRPQNFPSIFRGRFQRDCFHGRGTGFSLVEMMVVLVLIGLLAGLVTVNVRHYMTKGKQSAAIAEISSIKLALDTFYATYGRYPSNSEGLDILCRPSEKMSEPLLSKVPVDPWGKPYQYTSPGRNSEPYEVICYGADAHEGGAPGTADADISSSSGSSSEASH